MAKMFYSLEEVAQRLGVDEQAVRDMAAGGKLQQFRDRDKLMFKREQVDSMSGEGGSGIESIGLSGTSVGSTGLSETSIGNIGLSEPQFDDDDDDLSDHSSPSLTETSIGGIGLSETEPPPASPLRVQEEDTSLGNIGLSDTGAAIPLAGDTRPGTAGSTAGLPAGGSAAGRTAGGTAAGGTKSGSGSGMGGTAAGELLDIDDLDDLPAATPIKPTRVDDPRETTGVSVFDTDEIDHADPMAQTQVTSPVDDEELALESVGSGSGLLDLTRESDDTSLGAELLEEIYPGESSDAKLDAGAGSSGVFEGTLDLGEPSGLRGLTEAPVGAAAMSSARGPVQVQREVVTQEVVEYDPAGAGMTVGMLLGATAALILALFVAISSLVGVSENAVVQSMTETDNGIMIWCTILLVVSLILGGVGFFIGKAMRK